MNCIIYVDKVAFSFLLLGNALFLSDAIKSLSFFFCLKNQKNMIKEKSEGRKKVIWVLLFDNGAPRF